jgi:hypothetical protein
MCITHGMRCGMCDIFICIILEQPIGQLLRSWLILCDVRCELTMLGVCW